MAQVRVSVRDPPALPVENKDRWELYVKLRQLGIVPLREGSAERQTAEEQFLQSREEEQRLCLELAADWVYDKTPVLWERWRIYCTLCEMVQDRGYVLHPDDGRKNEYEFYLLSEQQRLEEMVIRGQHPVSRLWLSTAYRVQSLRVGTLAQFEKAMSDDPTSCKCVIVVTPHKILDPIRQEILSRYPHYYIDAFHHDELISNITHHRWQPQFKRLSEPQREAVYRKYGVRGPKFSRMYHDDAVARYFGWRQDELIECTRLSPHAGRVVTYRHVVFHFASKAKPKPKVPAQLRQTEAATETQEETKAPALVDSMMPVARPLASVLKEIVVERAAAAAASDAGEEDQYDVEAQPIGTDEEPEVQPPPVEDERKEEEEEDEGEAEDDDDGSRYVTERGGEEDDDDATADDGVTF